MLNRKRSLWRSMLALSILGGAVATCVAGDQAFSFSASAVEDGVIENETEQLAGLLLHKRTRLIIKYKRVMLA